MSSSLLRVNEEHASVDAALELLDGYDDLLPEVDLCLDLDTAFSCQELELSSDADLPFVQPPAIITSSLSDPAAPAPTLDVPSAQSCEKLKPKRKRAAPSAGKRGPKEIMADLRQQVTHLTTRLNQLQRLCPTEEHIPTITALRVRHLASPRKVTDPRLQSPVNTNDRSAAYQNAMNELQKLQESEKVNQKLKFAWRKELKLAKKMETLVRQIVALKSEPLLQVKRSNSNAIDLRDDLMADAERCVFNVTQLLNELVLLYHQAVLVCDSLNYRDTSRVFSSSHVQNDHVLGQTLEFTTNTPVTCSLRELDALLMTYVSSKQQQAKKQHGTIRVGRVSSSMCYETSYMQKMECQFGTILLDGVAVARKFDEPHRHVFASKSKVALAGTELTFEMDGLFIMTERRSNASSSSSSSSEAQALLQTFSRIQRDRTSGSSALNTQALEHSAYFQDFILVAKCEEMREKMLCLQSAVLEQLGAPQSATSLLHRNDGMQCHHHADCATHVRTRRLRLRAEMLISQHEPHTTSALERRRKLQQIMSFSLIEEERSLEAALAFLDSCGDEQQDLRTTFDVAFDLDTLLEEDDVVLDSPVSDPESIGSATHSSISDTGDRQAVARSKPTRQRTTKKYKAAGPTAPRRRTRTEILELHEQVIQLTARIDQLKERSRAQTIGPGFHSNRITHGARLQVRDVQGSSLELGDVVLERAKLHEAELLNAKLKVAWRRQVKLCQQLESLFKKKLTPADVGALFDRNTTPPIYNHAMVRDTSLAFAKLHHSLENLYAQAAAVSVSISKRDTTRLWSSSKVHHDIPLGDIFEYTTNTPLHCELDELTTQLWGMFSSEEHAKKKPQVVSHDTRMRSEAIHEHQFTRKLDCQFGSIYLNGVSVIRKFVEQHRIVIVFTTTLSLAGTELTFREIGWLILLQTASEQSASVPNITPPSVLLQTCYRLHSDRMSGSSANRHIPDASYFENFILQWHCETMRAYQLHIQSNLLRQFGSLATLDSAQSGQ